MRRWKVYMQMSDGSWQWLAHGPLAQGNLDIALKGYKSRHAAETDKRWYRRTYTHVVFQVFETTE